VTALARCLQLRIAEKMPIQALRGLRSLRERRLRSLPALMCPCSRADAAIPMDQSQHNCLPDTTYCRGIEMVAALCQRIAPNLNRRRSPPVHSRLVDFATAGEGDWIDLGGTRRTRPGTPIIVAPSGTSSITRVLAAIFAPFPMLTFPTSVAPVPI
jgi:hypothetical protein